MISVQLDSLVNTSGLIQYQKIDKAWFEGDFFKLPLSEREKISEILATPLVETKDTNGVRLRRTFHAVEIQDFWKEQTLNLPTHIKQSLFANFKRTIEKGHKSALDEQKYVRYAKEDLAHAVGRFHEHISKESLWLLEGKEIEYKARDIANLANSAPLKIELGECESKWTNTYRDKLFVIIKEYIEPKLELLGLEPFFIITKKSKEKNLESAVVRYMSVDYVQKRLEKEAASLREHIEILLGNVHKKKAPYASFRCVNEYRAAQKAQKQWVDEMVIVDADNPTDNPDELINLADAVKASTANKTNRRNELMTRMRGFEDLAAQQGFAAWFVTLTAPSKYHANSRKYNGFTPNKTQKTMTKKWSNARSKLNRNNISFFGLRVVEPHGDATPHWHMILFCLPEHQNRLQTVITDYFIKEDFHEIADDITPRVDFKKIDPAQGSATGYIAKYISKNIDAAYCTDKETGKQQLDDETGKPLVDSVNAVSAWASRWGIRQFQFLGGAPVTQWRECRRYMKDFSFEKSIQEYLHNGDYHTAEYMAQLSSMCVPADNGDFAEFTRRTGGAFQGRKGKLKSAIKEAVNAYGEDTTSIIGFKFGSFEFITREINWQITSARSALADLLKRRAASRSADNNCSGIQEQVSQHLSKYGSRLQQFNKHGSVPDPFIIN